jgi:hypothetical protein
MSELFGRKCSLIVGDTAGNGLELSALRVTFTVNKADNQSPAHAIIRVYNLSDDTARTVQKEFTRVALQAGYEGDYGLIFSGTVSQVRKGRENPTDTFLEIVATDGDEAYNFALHGRAERHRHARARLVATDLARRDHAGPRPVRRHGRLHARVRRPGHAPGESLLWHGARLPAHARGFGGHLLARGRRAA